MDAYEYELTKQWAIEKIRRPGRGYSWFDAVADLEKKGITWKSCQPKRKDTTMTKPVFTPTTFAQYIGQNQAKTILQKYINATKARASPFPHTLIYGKAGMGKTTLAKIVAKELHKKITIKISGSIIEEGGLVQTIKNLDGNILFLDEVHALPRNEVEKIYELMEEFSYNGESIKPFTIIGATTELGELLKDRRPFYERFRIPIELEDYTPKDLSTIGEQFQQNKFPTEKLNRRVLTIIAQNSRLTPRTTIRLTEATIYFKGDIQTVLNNFSIIYNGYTKRDLKLLGYLSKQKVIGLQGLATYLDTSIQNYLYEVEPYLVKTEMIIRTPRGRSISDKGMNLFQQLKKRS
jgi:Holliday junction DNA helicase RuvB